jgi:hypothetical protein
VYLLTTKSFVLLLVFMVVFVAVGMLMPLLLVLSFGLWLANYCESLIFQASDFLLFEVSHGWLSF